MHRHVPRAADPAARPTPGRLALQAATILFAASVVVADWSNSGGNAGRNGRTDEVGPDAPEVLWAGGPSSLIAWQPVVDGERVFVVRQTSFPPAGKPGGSPVFALDLDTGDVLWEVDVPFEPGDWTTWIAGARDGVVYACRGGNGATSAAPVYALDAATGATIWISDDEVDAGAYDGVIFADDGDLIVGSFDDVWRIDRDTGESVWRTSRSCSVTSSCGCARSDEGIYIVDATVGGHIVKALDPATGAIMREGPLMDGFTLQNTPMVGSDGTIFVSRTQNNPAVDFFYAFDDDDGVITERWRVPCGWTTTSEFTVGPDGSVYMIGREEQIQRLDPANGMVINETPPIAEGIGGPRFACDAEGRIFVANGEFPTGRVYSFEADLEPRWSIPVTNVNIGAPAFGSGGTLIVAGNGTNVRALRTARSVCPADLDGDGSVATPDLLMLLAAWGTDGAGAGLAEPVDFVDTADLLTLLAAWGDC